MKMPFNYLLICLWLLTDAATGYAQTLMNVGGRHRQSLNGKWQYLMDPFDSGFYDYRYKENPNGYFKAAKPTGKTDFVEYGFDPGRQLNVPGDWNSQDPKLLYYEGAVWYHRRFTAQRKAGQQYWLHFGAVNYAATVYVNGQKVGSHAGGFTPFAFDVSRYLTDGDNMVVVRADNRRTTDQLPTVNYDWWNYGGITRDVDLIEVADTHIVDYQVQLAKNSPNRVAGWVRLNKPTANQAVTVKIAGTDISYQTKTDATGMAPVNFDWPARKGSSPAIRYWSPESPNLYSVTIQSASDTIQERIGFRTLSVVGTDILLNGKSIFMRGVCLHEEVPQRAGRAYSDADARMLLTWAKEMGCNFVRLAHYPHNENMTRVADELGMLLWSEIPVYWTVQFDSPTVLKLAQTQLTENINRDRNRASVALWSVANETPISPTRTKFLVELVRTVRSLDSTRLVTAALEPTRNDQVGLVLDDPLGASLDVMGMNEYLGWYAPWQTQFDTMTWKTPYQKPLIVTEFGAEALYGNHGPADVASSWSEEFQEKVYRQQVAMLKRVPFLRGTAPWILADFRSPKRNLPQFQDGWNRKGLLSEQGQPKKAYFVMQDYYRQMAEKWASPAPGGVPSATKRSQSK